jgi:hypothetical protein
MVSTFSAVLMTFTLLWLPIALSTPDRVSDLIIAGMHFAFFGVGQSRGGVAPLALEVCCSVSLSTEFPSLGLSTSHLLNT